MPSEWSLLNASGLASYALLWVVVLLLGFLLLGTLRALALLRWRLEQLEATTPSRVGRSGLRPGKKAPDFTLPSVEGVEVALHDLVGRKVFLVFTQAGCGPGQQIMPELTGWPDATSSWRWSTRGICRRRQWAAELRARFAIGRRGAWRPPRTAGTRAPSRTANALSIGGQARDASPGATWGSRPASARKRRTNQNCPRACSWAGRMAGPDETGSQSV
jgi:hypothetical protein